METYIVELFLIILINFILNSILLFILGKYKFKIYKTSILFKHQINGQKALRKADQGIEKIILKLAYCIYHRDDLITNLLKLKYKNSEKLKYNRTLDLILFIILLFEIVLYFIVDSSNNLINNLLCGFYLWRIAVIIFIKISEILSFQFETAKFRSFNRTIIYFFINLIEIVMGYSFIYSSDNFSILNERNLGSIFNTLNIFTDWNLKEIYKLCIFQQLIVLSQIVVFIILLIVFVATVTNFNFERTRRKRNK